MRAMMDAAAAYLGCFKPKEEREERERRSPLPVIPLDELQDKIGNRQFSIQDFDVGLTISEGMFGRVRVTHIKDQNDRTPLALKIMKKSEVIKAKQVEMTKATVTLRAGLEHPFILSLLSQFQDSQHLFLLHEFVNGGDLFTRIKREGRLPKAEVKFYTAETCVALAHLHSKHIVHRGLSSDNCLVDSEGHVKITGFSCAKQLEGPKSRTWTLCGVPEYMAPEIVRNEGHSFSVDWWSFGVLIYEMIAGCTPFGHASDVMQIFTKVGREHVYFTRDFDGAVTSFVQRLLQPASKRLGRDGAAQVQKHKWFKGMDWEALLARQVPPPFIPEVRSHSDTSMFVAIREENSEALNALVSADSNALVAAEDQDQFWDLN